MNDLWNSPVYCIHKENADEKFNKFILNDTV